MKASVQRREGASQEQKRLVKFLFGRTYKEELQMSQIEKTTTYFEPGIRIETTRTVLKDGSLEIRMNAYGTMLEPRKPDPGFDLVFLWYLRYLEGQGLEEMVPKHVVRDDISEACRDRGDELYYAVMGGGHEALS